MICEFISPSFSFPLKKAFGKTVLGDFRATVKRKYFQIKTGKKLFEKLLCVLLIHLTDLQLAPQEAIHEDCSCGICKMIFRSPKRAKGEKENIFS